MVRHPKSKINRHGKYIAPSELAGIAATADRVLNRTEGGTDFILFVFPDGINERLCQYVTSGLDRKDVLKFLRKQRERLDEQSDRLQPTG